MTQYIPLTNTHPGIIDEVAELLDKGMNKSAIARHLGISRDRLRTFLKKHDLDNIKPAPQISEVQLNEIVQLYMEGKTWEEVTDVTGFSLHSIKTYIKKYGLDLNQISATHRLHRWDGRVFSSWAVVPGTTGTKGPGTVMTECVCGKRVVNLKSNLLSSASKSCGCIGFKKDTVGHDSSHFKWTCLETGEVVDTTLGLARQLNVRNPTMYRYAYRGQDYEDHLGYTWRPSLYKRELTHRRDLTPHLDFIRFRLADGKSFVAIAKELKVDLAFMYKFAAIHNLKSKFVSGHSILEDEQVHAIRKMHSDGMEPVAISCVFNVRPNIVYNILKGRTYASV